MTDTIQGWRHAVLPGSDTCIRCMAEQIAMTDRFFMRTGRQLIATSPRHDNPFFKGCVEAGGRLGLAHGISIDRASLQVRSAATVCRHVRSEKMTTEAGGYRARTLSSYFHVAPVERYVSPVHAVIGAEIDFDVTGLVTAKASGFLILYVGDDYYTRPWGGHCGKLSDALYLGVLEGVERLSGEADHDAQVAVQPPANTRLIDLDAFGVPRDCWKIPHPKVGAWVKASVITSGPDGAFLLGETVMIPERLAYYRAAHDHEPWVQDSSNGCAVGGSDEEAILFGMLEAIERDAFMIAWYGNLDLSPIDPASIHDEESCAYLRRMELCGVDVIFLDATVGVGVPTVIAVCAEPSGATCVGAGAHPDPERALKSALVEIASDFQVVAEHGKDRAAGIEWMLNDFSLVRAMEDHADLFALPQARQYIDHWLHPIRRHVTLDSLRRAPEAGVSVRDDLAATLHSCRDAGFEPLAVDMRSQIANRMGLACWKVVVPGLIPIDFGSYQRAVHMPRLAKRVAAVTGVPASPASFVANPVPHPFP